MDIHRHLLVDRDGDGLYDALKGRIFVPAGSGVETLRAASEVIARLGSRAVRLRPEAAVWSGAEVGFYIGRYPPRKRHSPRGFEVRFTRHGAAFYGRSSKELLEGSLWFSRWPFLFADDRLDVVSHCLAAEPAGLWWRDGGIGLDLARPGAPPDWSRLPAELAEIRVGRDVHRNPHFAAITATEPQGSATGPSTFSLGSALDGGGLYRGPAGHPQTLQGRLGLTTSCREALAVAARLSTEGRHTQLPLTGDPEEASVQLRLDRALAPQTAEIRIADREAGTVLELAGNLEDDLARAATYFADTFPELPDGTPLAEVESNLDDFLHHRTRLGRLLGVAALLSELRATARRALLPNPPPIAPRFLGLPVANSVRDGECKRWRATFPWEGARLMEILDDLPLDGPDAVRLVAFVSEEREVRIELADSIDRDLKRRGITAGIDIHCAYKPGLHWLLEVVGPKAADLGASRIEVSCAAHEPGVETRDRWLRELYPGCELLEAAHPDVAIEVKLGEDQTLPYRAVLLDDERLALAELTLSPPTLERRCPGGDEMDRAYPTTGGLRLFGRDGRVREIHLPTDRDLAWAWYTETVLPELLAKVAPGDPGPVFADLAITLMASEPDSYLGIDHEYGSAIEAMHEEFYFGTLEALSRSLGRPPEDRTAAPGWIMPFCRNRPRGDTFIQATRRDPGSLRLGVEDVVGDFHPVPSYPVRVGARLLRLNSAGDHHLSVHVDTDSTRAATFVERMLSRLAASPDATDPEPPLPTGVGLELVVSVQGKPRSRIEVAAREPVARRGPDLHRDRPLTPEEVLAAARVLNDGDRSVHLRPVAETLRGNPTVSLEAYSPTGPSASRVRLADWKPTLLVSARQHANEPTSTNADFLWLSRLLGGEQLLKGFNVVFHPLENPDGARLYTALCQLAPHHMHHAARYTSLGTDVHASPTIAGRVPPERRLHEEAERRWAPILHLNNHGYPAHEWARPYSGYVPPHFGDWSLPFGYMTILIMAAEAGELVKPLQESVGAALGNAGLEAFTAAQVARTLRYRSPDALPFEFGGAFPFMIRLHEAGENGPGQKSPPGLLTVISEVPDESVWGERWQACVLAHQRINSAVVATLEDRLERSSAERAWVVAGARVFSYDLVTRLSWNGS